MQGMESRVDGDRVAEKPNKDDAKEVSSGSYLWGAWDPQEAIATEQSQRGYCLPSVPPHTQSYGTAPIG